MRGVAQRVSAAMGAVALSMIVTLPAAAQMAREPLVQREQEVVYHARMPAGAVWVPGFWDLEGDPRTAPHAGWVWVAGRFEEPPMPGAHWDEGHWGWDRQWWTWIPGHWDEPKPGM